MADLLFWHRTSPEGEDHGGDPAARFPFWSVTKTAIAAACLRLAEAGRLDLDAAMPGFDFTLRQALTHTTGLRDYGGDPEYHAAVARGDKPWPPAEVLARVEAQGRLWAPETRFAYSNVGYMLVRQHLEAIEGQTLADVLKAQVLDPLGLDATRLDDFDGLHWPESAGYDPAWVTHGCLTGTARDAAHLMHGIVTGPLLSAASRAGTQTVTPVGGAIEGRPWTRCGYGLGLMIGEVGAGRAAIGHSGGGPFCANAAYHFPATGRTVAVFGSGGSEAPSEHRATALGT